ncbi:conserved hypothetical protein [Thermotomaculum hydrothermale]|uniref:YbbR family protein n=1 Tax=Thermotomaculum hydrothermale TaxID=981385 RepID=A0A7R6PN39_9BACT|nr:CdaR family protein [Thermotomaculum hydrothermale]BBB32633.1 conserved hypothetical protein [Thermotomaculum hydrothermale]
MKKIKIFESDWFLKVISLIIAFTMWAYISGQKTPKIIEKNFTAPIYFENTSDNMILTRDVLYEITVQLRGPETIIKKIKSEDVYITIDLKNKKFGLHSIPLTEDLVHKPNGVKVVNIIPNTIQFKIERKVTRLVPIKANLVGDLPDDLEVKKIILSPPTVKVEGPQSVLGKIQYFKTEVIDISDKMKTFETSTVVILNSNFLKLLSEPNIKVKVIIGEKDRVKLFRNITVTLANIGKHTVWINPKKVAVQVKGSKKFVDMVLRKNIKVFVDCKNLKPNEKDYILTPQVDYVGANSEQIKENVKFKTIPSLVNVRVFK